MPPCSWVCHNWNSYRKHFCGAPQSKPSRNVVEMGLCGDTWSFGSHSCTIGDFQMQVCDDATVCAVDKQHVHLCTLNCEWKKGDDEQKNVNLARRNRKKKSSTFNFIDLFRVNYIFNCSK